MSNNPPTIGYYADAPAIEGERREQGAAFVFVTPGFPWPKAISRASFPLLSCGLCATIAALALIGRLTLFGASDALGSVLIDAAMGLFAIGLWALGVIGFMRTLREARGGVVVSASPEWLQVRCVTPGKTPPHLWQRREIVDVRVRPWGLIPGLGPDLELWILGLDGQRFTLRLYWRRGEPMTPVETRLRQTLAFPPDPPGAKRTDYDRYEGWGAL